MRARYASKCPVCGDAIDPGDEIRKRGRRWAHASCEAAPTTSEPDRFEDDGSYRERMRDEADYQRGVAEANAYLQNKAMFGEELADRWELERELREGWDY